MQLITALLTWIFTVEWMSKSINHWLPRWKQAQNLWLIDWFYRILRMIAPRFLFCSLSMVKFNIGAICVGLILYLAAYLVKKITWSSAYNL